MEDKKKIHLDYMESTYDSIVQNDFSENERKIWNICLKYYNSNLRNIFSAIYDSIDENITIDSKISEPVLSFSNQHNYGSLMNELYQFKKPNKIIDTNFYILFYRMNLIYQDQLNIEFQDTEHFQKILRLENRTVLLGQRFNASRELIDIEIPLVRTFKHKEEINFKYRLLHLNLKKNGFLSEGAEIDSFKIIFSQNKPTLKFKKISWLGSILELKYLIKLMIEKGAIFDDVNYKYIIAECFLKEENVIKISQLDSPSGSKKKFETIKEIVETSLKKYR